MTGIIISLSDEEEDDDEENDDSSSIGCVSTLKLSITNNLLK